MMKKHFLKLGLLLFFLSQITFTQNFTHVNYSGYEFQPNDVLVAVSPSGKMFRADGMSSSLSGIIDTLRIFSFDENANSLNTVDISGFINHAAMEADGERLYLNIELYNVIVYPVSLPGVGTISTGGYTHGSLLVALSHDLQVEWYEFYGSNSLNGFWQCDITILNNGNLLFNVWEDNPDHYLYVKLIEFTPDGSFIGDFFQTELVYTMVEDSQGNLYITGPCANEEAIFNGTEVTLTFAYNLYVVKYDTDGNYLWSNHVEDVTCSFTDLAVNSDDDVFLFAPLIQGEYYFDDILLEVSSYLHYVVARLDENGHFEWAKTISEGSMGNTATTHIIQNSYVKNDLEGNLLICGSVQGDVTWNNGEVYSDPKSKPFVAQINSNGLVDWVNVAEYVYTFGNANHLDWSESGCLVIGGTSVVSVQFDTIQINYDGFIGYMARMQFENPTTDISNYRNEKIKVYPNPAGDEIYIDLTGDSTKRQRITIASLQGIEVFSIDVERAGVIKLDVEFLPKGVYFMRIFDGNENTTGKFVKG